MTLRTDKILLCASPPVCLLLPRRSLLRRTSPVPSYVLPSVLFEVAPSRLSSSSSLPSSPFSSSSALPFSLFLRLSLAQVTLVISRIDLVFSSEQRTSFLQAAALLISVLILCRHYFSAFRSGLFGEDKTCIHKPANGMGVVCEELKQLQGSSRVFMSFDHAFEMKEGKVMTCSD